MKENEAPEKIYLSPITLEEVRNVITRPADTRDIEYTRTDAFIEKAKKWMLTHTYMFQSIEEVDLYIEMFIKEMKGE